VVRAVEARAVVKAGEVRVVAGLAAEAKAAREASMEGKAVVVTVEAATALVFGDCGALATVEARAAGARVEAALLVVAAVTVEAVTVTVEAATARVDGDWLVWLGGGGDGGRDGGGSATQAVVRAVMVA
jgi:hypothetical protein